MNFCFHVSNNVVPIEDILDMHNVYDTLPEAARYNANIWCQYITWVIKICLDNLNEIKNGFTWMKCFTQICQKTAMDIILKIRNCMPCLE